MSFLIADIRFAELRISCTASEAFFKLPLILPEKLDITCEADSISFPKAIIFSQKSVASCVTIRSFPCSFRNWLTSSRQFRTSSPTFSKDIFCTLHESAHMAMTKPKARIILITASAISIQRYPTVRLTDVNSELHARLPREEQVFSCRDSVVHPINFFTASPFPPHPQVKAPPPGTKKRRAFTSMFYRRHDQAPYGKHGMEDTPRGTHHIARLTHSVLHEDLVDFPVKPNTQNCVHLAGFGRVSASPSPFGPVCGRRKRFRRWNGRDERVPPAGRWLTSVPVNHFKELSRP